MTKLLQTSLVRKCKSQFILPYCLAQTHFGFWVALDPNTEWRKEQHVRAQTPPPLPPKKWQAHFNPVSERSLAIDWQEILAPDQDLPFEYFHMERELLLPTQAHVTSAEDPLLTKWADSSPHDLTKRQQEPVRECLESGHHCLWGTYHHAEVQ